MSTKIIDGLLYTKEHEWVKKENDSLVVVGITDYAQSQLGDIVFVEVETEGQNLEKEEVFGTIEAVKTVAELYMPVSGLVKEVNSALEGEPEIINTDPYEKGWIVKVEMTRPEELNDLMDAKAYEEYIGTLEEES